MNPRQHAERAAPVKMWTRGVPVEDQAKQQLLNTASMPFIFKHLAVMPDVHFGIGATVGSVIPTKGAIIPAAVGVDIGCGMMAWQPTLTPSTCPTISPRIRSEIEREVPHGFITTPGRAIKGGWEVGAEFRRLALAQARRALCRAFSTSTRRSPHKRPGISSARSAAATTSSRSASTRTTPCG